MNNMGIFDLLMLPFNIAIAALLLPVVLIGGIILAVAIAIYTVLAALELFAGALAGVVKILEWIDKHFSVKAKPKVDITEGLKGETLSFNNQTYTLLFDAQLASSYPDYEAVDNGKWLKEELVTYKFCVLAASNAQKRDVFYVEWDISSNLYSHIYFDWDKNFSFKLTEEMLRKDICDWQRPIGVAKVLSADEFEGNEEFYIEHIKDYWKMKDLDIIGNALSASAYDLMVSSDKN